MLSFLNMRCLSLPCLLGGNASAAHDKRETQSADCREKHSNRMGFLYRASLLGCMPWATFLILKSLRNRPRSGSLQTEDVVADNEIGGLGKP